MQVLPKKKQRNQFSKHKMKNFLSSTINHTKIGNGVPRFQENQQVQNQ